MDKPDGYVELLHVSGEDPCGKVAIWYKGPLVRYEIVRADRAIYPDGTQQKAGDAVVCYSCNKHIAIQNLDYHQYLKDA